MDESILNLQKRKHNLQFEFTWTKVFWVCIKESIFSLHGKKTLYLDLTLSRVSSIYNEETILGLLGWKYYILSLRGAKYLQYTWMKPLCLDFTKGKGIVTVHGEKHQVYQDESILILYERKVYFKWKESVSLFEGKFLEFTKTMWSAQMCAWLAYTWFKICDERQENIKKDLHIRTK